MNNKSKYRIREELLGSGEKQYYIEIRGWFGIWYEFNPFPDDLPNWFNSIEKAQKMIEALKAKDKIVYET